MTAEEFLEIKEYLKQALKIEWRYNVKGGDLFICLVLDNEIISKIHFERE